MKNKILYMSALLALSTVTPVAAQIEVGEDSLVNVAFRKVAKEDIMGGVSSVNMRELLEKNYITYEGWEGNINSLDHMQGYVAGFNGSGMWGFTDHLVLIDGVPRDANNVMPSEIEEITFMKGAQAVVLYGSRAAKGAILITTKRGRVNDGLSVNVRANTGWYAAKSHPEYLGSAEYMTLFNEATHNDKYFGYTDKKPFAPQFSQELIANYASGSNPYRYPDIDFYSSDYIKKSFNHTDVTAEIEGGNERARFYANVSYNREGSYLNFGEAKDNYIDRFNVRGNVDVRINQYIDAYINANATYYNSRSANGGNYWEEATTMRPNRISPLLPISMFDPTSTQPSQAISSSVNIIDGMYILGGTKTDKKNIFAGYYAGGHSTWTSRQFQFDAGVNVDLGSLLKGLSFHTMIAVDYQTNYSSAYNFEYATYEPTWGEYEGREVITNLNNNETNDKKTGNLSVSGAHNNQTIAFNAHFDYNRTFGGVHNVSAMAVVNGFQQTRSGEYHKPSNANLGFQASYNYAKKYYADISIATPWSAKLPDGHRAGVSPSFTLGWNVAKESFMQGGIFDELTLSASYSSLCTDLDVEDYYMYLGTIQEGGWWDWNGLSGHNCYRFVRGGNDALTFIKRKEFSASIHAALLNRALTVDASYFNSTMDGGIISAANQMPSYFKVYYPESSFLSYLNYNKDNRKGFDVAVNYKKNFGDFGFNIGASLTHYVTKATKRDDSTYADEYQYREGKPLDAIWGYESVGYFSKDDFTWDEATGKITGFANGVAEQALGSTAQPGDLKYKDQNGDGIIDEKDQVNLATGGWYGAPTTLGVNLTFKYKNFTLFILGTGGFGGHGVKNSTYWWAASTGKYSSVVRDRVQYTYDEYGNFTGLANAATAAYPRLTAGSGKNNYQTSDFWLYSTSRFDLAKIQLTYDFPKSFFNKINFIKGASVYVSGSNLLTFAKEKEILEMNVGSAPQHRFYNLGLTVAF